MELDSINPYIRYADMRAKISEYRDFVLAYDHRLFVVLSGVLNVFFNDTVYGITANGIVIIPPAFPYKLASDDSCRFVIVDFDLDRSLCGGEACSPENEQNFKGELVFGRARSESFPLVSLSVLPASELAESMYRTYCSAEAFSEAVASAMLKQIILYSARSADSKSIPESVRSILAYIDSHLAENITNATIGDKFSYHCNYVNSLFKKYTGNTLRSYIVKQRLKKSCELLKLTELSVNQIGEECGFESTSYFIKRFCAEYGISPLKYRKKANGIIL